MNSTRVNPGRRTLVFGVTIVIALLLALSPLPAWAEAARPAWVLMVVVYWSIACPQWFGVASAWCVGLVMDVLLGTMLGQHALGFALVSAFATRYHLVLRNLAFAQQALVVGGLVVCELLVVASANLAVGLDAGLPADLMHAATTAVLWPWVFLSLRATRRRFLRGAHP